MELGKKYNLQHQLGIEVEISTKLLSSWEQNMSANFLKKKGIYVHRLESVIFAK